MSLYDSVLKALPGLNRPEDTALGRVKGFLGDVGGTIGAGFKYSPQGTIQSESEEKSSKMYEDNRKELDDLSSNLKIERQGAVTAQRTKIESGGFDIKSGGGTLVNNMSDMKFAPDVIPEAPTGQEIATQFTKQEMAESLGELIKSGYLPQRSKLGGVAQSFVSSMTMGVVGREDKSNPLTMAQIEAKPITTAESASRVAGALAGALPTYSLMARAIGTTAMKVGPQSLRTVASENPMFWSAIVENGGQEIAEMAVRKGTGQEYGASNFVLGMMFGGTVDALRLGVLKNVDTAAARAQINKAVGDLQTANGKTPTMDEVYENIKDQMVAGTTVPYRMAFSEDRMLYYREKTPNLRPLGESRLINYKGPRNITPQGDTPAVPPTPRSDIEEKTLLSSIEEDAMRKEIADDDLELMALSDSSYQSYVENLPAVKKAWEGLKYVTSRLVKTRLLESYGLEGKTISRKMLSANYDETILKSQDFKEINSLPKITDQEAQKVGDHLFSRGKIPLETPAEQAWGNYFKNYMVSAAREQLALGMSVKDPATGKVIGQVKPDTYYIPHNVSKENQKLFSGWLRKYALDPQTKSIIINEKIARKVMEASKGKIKSVDEAMRILRFQKMRPGMRSGHLELARSDIHGIPKDFLETDVRKILESYIPEYRKRTSWVKQFGAQGKYGEQLDSLLREASANGKDVNSMRAIVENVTGLQQAAIEKTGSFSPGVQTMSSKIRALMAGTKLSFLTSVTNVSDVSKAFGITGRVIPTMRAMFNGFLGPRVPAAMDMNIKGLAEDLGDGYIEQGAKLALRVGGFERTEAGVRGTVHNASVADASIIVKRLNKILGSGKRLSEIKDPSTIKRVLDENIFGVSYRRLLKYMDNPDEAIARGHLTPQEKDLIGTRMVYETQPISPQDVPYYANNPLGRIPYQFKTFSIKTAAYLNKHIVQEAKAGNVRPLVAFFAASQVFGEASADFRAFLIGKKRTEKIGARMMENMLQVGGLGLVTDVLSSIMYGNYGGGLYQWLVGPAIKESVDTLNLLRENTPQDAAEKFGKRMVRNVPVIGPFVKEGFGPLGIEGLNPSQSDTYSPGFPVPFKDFFLGTQKSGSPQPPRPPSVSRPRVPRPPSAPRP